MAESVFPATIRSINSLPDAEKHSIYKTLLPDWLFDKYHIDRDTLQMNGRPVVRFRCPPGSRALELIVKRFARDADPLLYLNMADTFNNQILVLLVVVNDLDGPRFNIDIDAEGNPTHLGTTSRNIAAEIAAMQTGLAPGQVRRGLRVFKSLLPIVETFIDQMGHPMFLIEPFAYHNAIVFERYGFNYVQGLAEMQRIHEGFAPGSYYDRHLDGSTPFRKPGMGQTIRGRSWAIHDRILGHPYTGFQMYKRIGEHAGISTSPSIAW